MILNQPYTEAVIITAASKSFGNAVLALIGSLNLNWPLHPRVIVYDLGLTPDILQKLNESGIEVRKVPHFVPHWRKHFSWKLYCLHDAQAKYVIWMDAGICILRPLDEIFTWLDKVGYFFLVNYELLDYEASEEACKACGVPVEFRLGKHTLPSGLMGFRKEGVIASILEEAFQVAHNENAIKATQPTHRHDQAIISLLFYKHFGQPLFSDGLIYLGWDAPDSVPGQKVWVHRRLMRKEDTEHFIRFINEPGEPFLPKAKRVIAVKEPLISRILKRPKKMLKSILIKLNLWKEPVVKEKIYDGVKD